MRCKDDRLPLLDPDRQKRFRRPRRTAMLELAPVPRPVYLARKPAGRCLNLPVSGCPRAVGWAVAAFSSANRRSPAGRR